MNNKPQFFAIVPAAGAGRRVGGEIPKQYLTIQHQKVIEHTLAALLTMPAIVKVIVAISSTDDYWPQTQYAAHPQIITVAGGKERADSVLNGLLALRDTAQAMDWILVHDAARPCLKPQDLLKLTTALAEHPIGGLLGYPVRDTMKRVNERNSVLETVARQQLWHAQTPQLFRYELLCQALIQAQEQGYAVTDEASAIEYLGYQPQMVAGSADNIKITRADDLLLAEMILKAKA